MPEKLWKLINDIERKADRAESRLYELDTLRSNVDSLEHTVRELGFTCDGLRYELEACMQRLSEVEQQQALNEEK